ncbi:MAG: YfhO family protein, partial [Oscillospiraceae bacterium]
MQRTLLKKTKNNSTGMFDRSPFLFYSLFAFFVCLTCFACLAITGKTWITGTDGFMQYYPALVWLRNAVSDVFHGNGFPLWSWNMGLGADTIATTAYAITDPFAYIAAAFPRDRMDIGYTVSELLRFYCAGSAMFAFLKYEKMDGSRCIMGGLGYAFCSWALTVTIHAFFLNPLILFPLIILGIHRIDREKKPTVFILAVVAALITSVYFSFMTGLMAGVYFLVRYFFLPKKPEVKDFFKRLGRYFLYFLLALALAAPIAVPCIFTLLQAPKDTGAEFHIFHSLKDMLVYFTALINGQQAGGSYAAATISGVFFACAPLLLWQWKERRNRLATLFFFVTLVMLGLPVFGSLFNGMSYTTGRWCYMLVFFAIWALLNGFDGESLQSESNLRFLLKGDMALVGFWLFFLLLGTATGAIPVSALYFGLFNIAFVLVTMVVLCWGYILKQKEFMKRVFVWLLVCSVTVSSVMVTFPNFKNLPNETLNVGAVSEDFKNSVQRAVQKLPDQDFYRTEQVEYQKSGVSYLALQMPANESYYYNAPTVSGYAPTFDRSWSQLHKNLNNNSGYCTRVCVFNNDNRSRMNFLMGVRYFLGDNERTGKKSSEYAGYGFEPYEVLNGVSVQKSRFETSLGYGVPAVMRQSDWLSYSPLDREQILMQAVIVPDDYAGTTAQIDKQKLQLDTEELAHEIVKTKNVDLGDNGFTVGPGGGAITLQVAPYENSELYCNIQNLQREKTVYADYQREKIGKKPTFQQKLLFRMTNLGYRDSGEFDVLFDKDGVRKRQDPNLESNQAFADLNDYLCNLGSRGHGDGIVNIELSEAGEYHYDAMKFYTVSQKHFDQQAEALSQQCLVVEKKENDFISGTVRMKTEGILRMSII